MLATYPNQNAKQSLLLEYFCSSTYLPVHGENYKNNCVVYTGTHDNNTTVGWINNDATEEEKKNLKKYFKTKSLPKALHSKLIKLAMNSIADTAIVPIQDVLGLGKEARMNTPGTTECNWQWRLSSKQLKASVKNELSKITQLSNRC